MENTVNISVTPADIVRAAKAVPSVATQEKWVFTFDKDAGTFYYSPHRVSRNAQLYQLNDEMAIYMDKNTKKPEGVMIEYYQVNFLEHHKEFKPLSEAIFNNDEDIQEVKPLDKAAYSMKIFFERTITDEAEGDLTLGAVVPIS